MKTAQQKKHSLILATSVIILSTAFLTHQSGVLAQSASHPFVLTSPSTENTQKNQTFLTSSEPETTAAQEVALTAIPPRLGDDGTLKAKPGEKLQVQLRVRNISEKPISIVTSAQNFILDIDGKTPITIDDSGSNRWSLASWLTITPTEHLIGSKSTVGINVLIEVPQDALPGGHYAMVLHEPGNQTTIGGSNTAINQRVGTLLYVIVDGKINEEAYVRDFSFPKFSEYGPVPFNFTVENNSDIHITPQMSVEIFDMFNRKVETIGIESKNIFPLASRDFSGEWRRIWGWGLYKAKLTMSYGSTGSIVVAHSSFWLLPLRILLAACTILFGILFAGLAIKKHFKHRKTQEEKRIAELEKQIEEMQANE